MSAAKHTPGPWVIDDRPTYSENGGLHAIARPRGACVAAVEISFSCHSIHAPQTIGKRCPSPDEWDAEGLANAHLIAAAPELLEALHDALALICEYEPESTSFAATQARAAIAKAEGRA